MSTDIQQSIDAKKRRLEELKAKRAARTTAAPASPSIATSPSPRRDSLNKSAPPPPSRANAAANVLEQVNKLVGGQRADLGASYALANHSIMPKERHVYDKGCQTEFGVALEGKHADMEEALRAGQEALMQKEEKVKILMEQLKIDKMKYDQIREEERLAESKELTPEESNRILGSQEFKQFFNSSTRLIERALDQSTYDITVDYASGEQDTQTTKDLRLRANFSDKRVNNRAITSIDWSKKFPELLLCSYAGQNDPMSFDPDGTVMVWNMHLSARPEYVFTCNAAVLSAHFHPTNPSLIVGSCQSGQVVIWDTREKSTPVNRTSLSHGHTHPVYALDTVSVVNRLYNVVSMSTDGHMCVWSDNNLHDPSKEVFFKHGKDEITTTCFSFPKNGQDLVMGSDEGILYKGHVYDNEGIYAAVEAHKAPITNVQFHPSQKNNNLADVFLTSSFDWTVKVWSSKVDRPLLTLESARDYVFDAQWHPINPALFAMGDGTGKLDLWNVNKDTDVPVLSTHIDDVHGEKPAISKLSWSESGSQIACGSSSGTLSVFELHESHAQPGHEDLSAFYDMVQQKIVSV